MAFQGDSIFWVEVEKIVPNPFQPRREFDEDKLRELAESIRMYGVLQPLTVTRKEVFDESGAFHTEYELIAGERRLRASRLAGVEQVPVLIRSGEQTEQEKLELAIIENLQREDLNAVDRALAFKQLADMFELSHAEVAKKVGRSREYVSNSIRILALPDHVLDALRRNEISEGHARTLLMLKERPVEQDVVFREILLKKLSVREVERISRKIATDKVRKKEWLNTDAHLIEMERAFTDTLGTRVQISKTDFGGKLTIDYFSEGDLEKLLSVIKTRESIWETPPVPAHAAAETGETVIRTMDEMVAPLQEIVDATPLEVVEAAVSAEANGSEMFYGPAEESVSSVGVQFTAAPSTFSAPMSVPDVPTASASSLSALHDYAAASSAFEPVATVVAPVVSVVPVHAETVPPVLAEMVPSIQSYAVPTVPYVPEQPVAAPQYQAPEVPVATPQEVVQPAVPVAPMFVPPIAAQPVSAPVTAETVSTTPVSAPVVPQQAPVVPQPSTDDDLYSMRNFSL